MDTPNRLYSRILPGPDRVHVSTTSEGFIELPPDPSANTVHQLLVRGVKASENGECLGERAELSGGRLPYVWLKYQEVLNRAHRIGCGLVKLGFKPGQDTRIGFCGKNCPEWTIGMHGCISFSMVPVPLYHNYHQEALSYIVEKCQLRLIFCDTEKRAEQFLRHVGDMPSLKRVVVLKPEGDMDKNTEMKQQAEKANIQLMPFQYLLTLGDNNLIPMQPPKPDDLYLICHTSGTTGPPKGVTLTHKGMVAAIGSCIHNFDLFNIGLTSNDVYFSFLPLAHIFEHLVQGAMLYSGCKVGFFGGDVAKLLEDMTELEPTIAAMVPRVLTRIQTKIQDSVQASGWLKQTLFNMAMKSKMAMVENGALSKTTLWDQIVLKKVQTMVGGKLRMLITGGAPVAPEVLRFWRAAFGTVVLEGYGQTECAAAGVLILPSDLMGGHVGGPAGWASVKLIDVPEMDYFCKDDKGEILFKGVGVMKGYYLNDVATKEAIDSDGWLHTGDIGFWLPNGGLKIIDRKKEFFKLAQGDYVSPEVIENAYSYCPLVSQIYVTGYTLKTHLVAIVVPDVDKLRCSIVKEGIPDSAVDSVPALLAHAKVRTHVLGLLREVGASKGLNSLEQVKAIHLTAEAFSNEDGLLTPTLKLRRVALKKKFADIIDILYAEVEKAAK